MRQPAVLVPCALSLLALSCAPSPRSTAWRDVNEMTPPALAGTLAADPSLAVDPRGRVALSWVTRGTHGADAWLAVTSDSGGHWTQPVRVNERPGKVASDPESRPVLAWGSDGLLVAAWASVRPGADELNDIAVRVSADGGASWGREAIVNSDRSDPLSGYHGFLAVDVLPDGRPIVAWLDGRADPALGGEPERAEIYASTSGDGGGSWSPNVRVAHNVCACCRIALESERAANGGITVAIAYRGAANDLRDPRLAVSTDGGGSFAFDTLMAADRWKLAGCPSVGPTLTLAGSGGHYAWYTGESPEDAALAGRPAPGVYLVAWRNRTGASGSKRRLDDGPADATSPLLAVLARATLVGVLGRTQGPFGRHVLALRRLESDGRMSAWLYLGSGVKSAAIAGAAARGAWAAWAEAGGADTHVRVARLAERE